MDSDYTRARVPQWHRNNNNILSTTIHSSTTTVVVVVVNQLCSAAGLVLATVAQHIMSELVNAFSLHRPLPYQIPSKATTTAEQREIRLRCGGAAALARSCF